MNKNKDKGDMIMNNYYCTVEYVIQTPRGQQIFKRAFVDCTDKLTVEVIESFGNSYAKLNNINVPVAITNIIKLDD